MGTDVLSVPGVVGGEEITGDDRFVDLDPSTGEPWAQVARLGAPEVDRAVAAARDAFDSRVRRQSAEARSGLLLGLAGLIRRDAARLAELESRDVGKPLRQAAADVSVTARYFEFYAGVLRALHGETLPPSDGVVAFTRREPFGVTAHITPWNYPLQMLARTVAPALAAGNCCVLKPAEDSPVTAVEIARLAGEAGFPAGMFNVVPGLGTEAGAALAGHPGIDHVSFTGSRPVGTSIATAAAVNVVPVVLELGGKSPNVVFADADLDHAAPLIVNAITQNCGQTCSAGSRVLVHEDVHDELVDRVRARFEAMSIGRGLDDPDLGPLINAKQRDRVATMVERARADAELVTGGRAPEGDALAGGFFFAPTLFDRVPVESEIGQEEVFGPVLAVSTFTDEDQAVAMANATDYGLVAAVWTRDVGRAHRVAEAVRAGQVFVNTYGAAGGIELPFGGWKRSGYGREKGVEGLVGYTQTKTVVIGL
jgi:aldehyde dehydrogenase (NAD+)/betaine-aldehyde dehydrogenase